MPYFFNDSGTLTDRYDEDKDARIFVVKDLQECFSRDVVEATLRDKSPLVIHGLRVLLSMDEPQLRDIAATVYSETGAGTNGHNAEEAEGIARVIRNRADHKDVSYGSPKLFSVVGGSTMFGRGSENYTSANATDIGSWVGNMKSDLEATIRALVKSSDITRGAYFWDAKAAVLKKTHTWVVLHWIGGTDPHFKGTTIEGKYTPTWIWKRDLGKTSFFAYNPKGSKPHGVWP